MDSQHSPRALVILVLCVGLYTLAYAWGFLSSPLGRYPLLDGAENMALAQQVATRTLPAEPFFRAMLYPGLLAIFLRFGVTMEWLPVVAGLLGCACHVGSTVWVYFIARRGWDSARAGLLAAGLFGLNPVAIYFAAEPLDTTLGLFLFLAGLNFWHWQVAELAGGGAAGNPLKGWLPGAIGTACWALAMLARPHYALVLAALPLFLVFCGRGRRAVLFRLLGVFAVTSLAVLGGAGLIQKRVSGEFAIMPTQGGYSLWVGNRPGANGRYYEQKIHIAAGSVSEGENPARIESEVLYRRETGERGEIDPRQLSSYWRGRTVNSVKENFGAWIGLMLRKAYYLFNNFEQYNNKTYAVQKGLAPTLKLNPLGWGVTFVLATAGVVLAVSARRRCQGALFLFAMGVVYAGGVILFFVSDRFRLPLMPLLCVAGGVWATGVKPFFAGRTRGLVLVAALVAALLSFSRLWSVHDTTPAVQDYVLMSIAARKGGDDREGLLWARRALEQRRDHPDALACAVASFFNLQLAGISPEADFPGESWELQVVRAEKIPQPAATVRLVQGVALWKTGNTNQARAVLSELAAGKGIAAASAGSSTADDALGVLLLTRLAELPDLEQARKRLATTRSFYLMSAAARQNGWADLVSNQQREVVKQVEPYVRRLFP